MPTLQINSIAKSFSSNKVLNTVSLEIDKGEIYALVGSNGAGKTTLIKILVGLLRPDSGSVAILEHDIQKDEIEAKKHIGYIPDNPSGYDYLSGREFLVLTGRLRGMSETSIKRRVSDLLTVFPIKDIIDYPMEGYSRGNKQKVIFLSALISDPKLIVIDEPIVGLDPQSIEIFGNELKKFAKGGGSVLFSTHILSFAQEYADRYGILDGGKITSEGTVSKQKSLESLFKQKLKK